jgi:hypothetical protein
MLRAFPCEEDKKGIRQRENKNDVKNIKQKHEGSTRWGSPEKSEARRVDEREWQVESLLNTSGDINQPRA